MEMQTTRRREVMACINNGAAELVDRTAATYGLEAESRWQQANDDATPSDANRYQLVRLERLLESL